MKPTEAAAHTTKSKIDRVLIAPAAKDTIEAEARRTVEQPRYENETGGILIGRRIDLRPLSGGRVRDALLIVAATGPGEAAFQRPDEFNPDVAYINRLLEAYRSLYPRTDYIGTWHKHPPHYQHFSPGDLRTAREIFDDPSYKVDETFNPIVYFQNNELKYLYYYLDRDMVARGEAFAEIKEKEVFVLEETDQVLLNERVSPAQRIDEETYRLTKQGWRPLVRLDGSRYLVVVRLGDAKGTAIYFDLPPDYPFHPPLFGVEQNNAPVTLDQQRFIASWPQRCATTFLVDLVQAIGSEVGALKSGHSPSEAGHSRPPPPRAGKSFWTNPRFLLAVGLALGLLALIAFGLFQTSRSSPYASDWMIIDQVVSAAEPGISELQDAQSRLETMARSDPTGKIYARNSQATAELARVYVLLGERYLRQQPPNLTSAEFFFQQALSLGIDDAQASGGLAQTANAQASGGLGQIATTQSITQEALRATAAAQTRAAELLRRWQAVEDAGSAPERQVALLVALESEGVAADPKGVQITKRLFDARMGYGDDLLKQQRFIEALAIYDLAGLNASDADAATRQRVADSKANTFLQQAQSALDAQSFVLAGEYVNRVFTLTPPPSTALRQQAELRLTAIAEAKQTLDNRVRLQQAWRAYDDARNNGQWSIALGVLADIVSVAGEQPDQSAFPPDENDLRLYDIPQLRADTRLRLAADLLVGGQIDGARAQYDAILADSNVDTKIRSQSASEEAKLQTVSDLWSTVNRARRDGRWKDVETTLQKLATMVGEGGRNPVQGRTVAALRREAQLQTEAARQSLITPSAPVVAPSATEAAPSATVDAGLPTVMPTADPNVLPTADPGAPPAGSATPAEPETPSPSDGQAPGGGSTQP